MNYILVSTFFRFGSVNLLTGLFSGEWIGIYKWIEKNKLRGQYFKKHNIDEKYNTIENEIHHIIEWNEAEKGLVSKQEVDSIGNFIAHQQE